MLTVLESVQAELWTFEILCLLIIKYFATIFSHQHPWRRVFLWFCPVSVRMDRQNKIKVGSRTSIPSVLHEKVVVEHSARIWCECRYQVSLLSGLLAWFTKLFNKNCYFILWILAILVIHKIGTSKILERLPQMHRRRGCQSWGTCGSYKIWRQTWKYLIPQHWVSEFV